MSSNPTPTRIQPVRRTPRDIARDMTLTSARKIELLKSIKDHNAAPWQLAVSREADIEMSRILRQ